MTRTKYSDNIQRGHKKSLPNPDTSIWVPEEIVEEIGLRTHMGARVDSAILSSFAYHYKLNYEKESIIKFTDGRRILIPKGMFVVSINTIAEDLYFRWFLKIPRGKTYVRFYEKIKKAVGRLKKSGHIKYHGYARKEYKGVFGSVWSLDGTPLGKAIEECPVSHCSGMFLTQSLNSVYNNNGLVNVVDLIGSMIVQKFTDDFNYTELCGSYYSRNVYTRYMDWMRAVARVQQSGSRHMTVGSFRESDIPQKDISPAKIPYIVIDLDCENPLDGYDAACRTCDYFFDIGCKADDIFACYTGGTGYHVYVPSGLFGNPLFHSPIDSRRILSSVTDDIGEYVDKQVFVPSHLIRMIGSKHERTGLFKTPFSVKELFNSSPMDLIERSKEFKRFDIPNPEEYKSVPELVECITTKAAPKTSPVFTGTIDSYGRNITLQLKSYEDTEEATERKSSNTTKLALGHVSEREEWYPEKGYAGRDMACFVSACHFIRNSKNVEEAWEKLKENNDQYKHPPLKNGILKAKMNSAVKATGAPQRREYAWT